MLKIINKTTEIASFLNNQDSSILKDYRITVKINMEIDVQLLVTESSVIQKKLELEFSGFGKNIFATECLESEIGGDKYLSWLFDPSNKHSKIDLGLRRRLNNLIDIVDKSDKKPNHPVITTFYSYKGGMGRSTTLASFASYCAKIRKKKVVIIDCDFEAPGFTNYFDLNNEILSQKNGVVEYLLDKQFVNEVGEKLDIQSDYSYKVGYEYVGEGEIYIVPAGNLSSEYVSENVDTIHRTHYLEALARLDISSVDNIVEQFEDFINDISTQLKPDIILLDSRTGFNDTFAVLASLSEIIVGFFGNNIQTKIGIEQFLDTFGSIEIDKDIFLVNSITNGAEYLDNFKKFIDEFKTENSEKFTFENGEISSEKEFKIYEVRRDENLSKLGTDFAFKKVGVQQSYDVNFVNLIDNNLFFQPFFDSLYNSIETHFEVSTKPTVQIEETISEKQTIANNSKVEEIEKAKQSDIKLFLEKNVNKVPTIELRKKLLEKLHDVLETLPRYGEDRTPTINDFYFRDCMKDLFNRDKYLLIGSKGTGKTSLYQALKEKDLKAKLQERSKLTDDSLFINLISIHKDENSNRYLETTDFGIKEKITDTDYFFKRFWVVYLWNALMLDESIKNSKYFSKEIEVLPIKNEPTTIERFKNYIADEKIYLKIFGILQNLDNELKKDDKNIVVLFEQLDFIVKPEYWPQAISPLINFWRSNPFSKILPKLFLRSDLFNKLTGVTNIQNLSSRVIDIEWTKKELFAYFFKLVIQNCRNEFYLLVYAHYDYTNLDFIIELDNSVNTNDNQVPTEDKYLKPLVEAFFGKYANWNDVLTDGGFGESYDWFEKNLKDANDKISLRPFLNLIEKAIENFLLRYDNRKNPKSILSASFYADNSAREFAVKQHFDDLAKEKGNKALLKFYQYITVDGDKKFKVPVYRRNEFNLLLNNMFTKYRNDADFSESIKNTDDLKEILKSNGIIKETDNTNRTYTNYVIPYLYRKFLQVSVNNSNLDRFHKPKQKD
jgi:MinD-like ATPase involved in chromosome partitioning or flagellar assembly